MTISAAELLSLAQDEPRDESLSLRVGDWVTVPGNAQGTVWVSGHVEQMVRVDEPVWRDDDRYRIYVGYASRESSLPAAYRALAMGAFITTTELGEIWRRRRVWVTSSLEHAGRTIRVPSSDYEWYQVR